MKKLIITFIVSCIGLSLSAQYFDTFIEHNEDEMPIYNSIELPNNEYVVGVIKLGNASNQLYESVLYKISYNGAKLDSLILPNTGIYNILYHNKKIYFTASNNYAITQADTLILGIIDPVLFDTIKVQKHISQMRSLVSINLRYSNFCNCLIASGQGVSFDGIQHPLVLQFDSTLNIIRKKYYKPWYNPRDSTTMCIFYNVLDNPSNDGYWALASDALDSIENYHGGIILLDSNLIRDSTVFHSIISNKPSYIDVGLFVGLRGEPFNGVKLTDSTYLFGGSVMDDYLKNGDPFDPRYELEAGYVVMDNNLNYVTHEFYGKKDTLDVSSMNMVDKNNNFVYVLHGSANMEMHDNYFGLTKVDEAGNRLWTRYYSTYNRNIYPFSVKATTDGGALMVGYAREFGKNRDRDVYLIKVDANGSRILTDIPSSEIEKENYRIYPNPAKDNLNLLKINQFKPYEFELYDTFGRLVKTVKWSESHQQINVADLASGMYVYRITDEEGRKGSGKIMVE